MHGLRHIDRILILYAFPSPPQVPHEEHLSEAKTSARGAEGRRWSSITVTKISVTTTGNTSLALGNTISRGLLSRSKAERAHVCRRLGCRPRLLPARRYPDNCSAPSPTAQSTNRATVVVTEEIGGTRFACTGHVS